MARRAGLLSTVIVCAAVPAAAANLEHRVWLMGEIPSAEDMTALRSIGVDGVVVPVGSVRVGAQDSQFTVRPLPNLVPLSGWTVSALVWAEGSGRNDGGAAEFVSQLAPVERLLAGSGSVVLAVQEYWEGLPRFAAAVARRTGRPVEVAASAAVLARGVPRGGWRGVTTTAVAFGLPAVLGFPESTFHDDEGYLDHIEAQGIAFRVAVVTGFRVDPEPLSPRLSIEELARRDLAGFRPGPRGNTFTLLRPYVWGGRSLAAGDNVTVEGLEAVRYHRSLAAVLRRVRRGMLGWDTAGFPAPAPTVGMSREAFLEYFRGTPPVVQPEVRAESVSAGLRLAIRNPTPFPSALATTGNFAEVRFSGAELRDVLPGGFSGVEYGRYERGQWRATVAREATAVRFFVTFLAPGSEISGAVVQFFSRPREVRVGWNVRDPDGTDRTGPFEPVDLNRR